MATARRTNTTLHRSPSSRGWTPFANGPACTSGPPANADCTTWSGRSSTTPSTRRWPATRTPSIVDAAGRRRRAVIDNGRGIPVDMHPTEKRPTVEVVLTILHAGGKFDSRSYAVSGGLHGVGISVVNALSYRLDVDIKRNGKHWHQQYDYSKPGKLIEVGDVPATTPAPRSRSGPTRRSSRPRRTTSRRSPAGCRRWPS